MNPWLYGCSDSNIPKFVVKLPQFWKTCLIGFLPPPSDLPKSSPRGEFPLAPPSGLGGLSSLFLKSRSSFFLGPAITREINAKFLKSWKYDWIIVFTMKWLQLHSLFMRVIRPFILFLLNFILPIGTFLSSLSFNRLRWSI